MSSQDPSSSFAASQPEISELPHYRPAKALHSDLRQHCIIYFEHELYSQALSLLSNFLVAANSSSSRAATPAYVPPVYIISLIATLTVHPSLTTRTNSEDKQIAADQALHYLRAVNKTVGASNAHFHEAFSFVKYDGFHSSRRPNRRQTKDQYYEDVSSDDGKYVEEVDVRFAREGSLWSSAEDFWCVVGWAFNCSVKRKERWSRWKHWLEFMLEVLEDDWLDKTRIAKHSKGVSAAREEVLRKSMIFQYLVGSRITNRTARRKMMRAIFADGSAKSMAEFKEIFNNETKDFKKPDEGKIFRNKTLDILEGDFGDYDWYKDEDESDDGTAKSRASKRSSRKSSKGPHALTDSEEVEDYSDSNASSNLSIDAYGGLESLLLRRRLMVLLIRVAVALPDDFTTVESMYDIYTEFIRTMPLPVFSFFVSPSSEKGSFPLEVHASLNKVLLRPLLDTTKRHEDNWVRQDILEEYYLPFGANLSSVVDNAKVSMLLCSLLGMLKTFGELETTRGLVTAIEAGLATRQTKVGSSVNAKTRKGVYSANDAEEQSWLQNSEQMLQLIAGIPGL